MKKSIQLPKFKQILSSTGWFAKFKEDDGSIFEQPLACWALISKPGVDEYNEPCEDDCIVGMTCDGSAYLDDVESSNFDGYIYRGSGKAEL